MQGWKENVNGTKLSRLENSNIQHATLNNTKQSAKLYMSIGMLLVLPQKTWPDSLEQAGSAICNMPTAISELSYQVAEMQTY